MKALVIYFSRADENYFGGQIRNVNKGNTEVIAEFIKEFTDADLFKIERKIPYSSSYQICIKEAQDETRNNQFSELKNYLKDIKQYDVIFIGGPIYWGSLPQAIFTQLKQLNFENKIIMPFVTHEGSGFGNVLKDIKKYAPNAEIKNGLAIVGSNVYSSKQKVERWIKDELR